MQGVLEQRTWPTFIQTQIFERTPGHDDMSVGILEIDYSQQTTATATSAGLHKEADQLRNILFSNSTDNSVVIQNHDANNPSPKLAVSGGFEKRWFACIHSTLLYIISKPSSDTVTDTLPNPTSKPIVYHLECAPFVTRKDRMDIYIYPKARELQHRLMWDVLAKTLLLFGTRVAEG